MTMKLTLCAIALAAIPFVASADVELKYGPYLINPAPDAISIGFTTPANSGGAIDLRVKGESDFQRFYNAEAGQALYNRDHHLIHLKKLKPGTEYEYRVVTMDPKKYVFSEGDSIYTFKTFDPSKKSHRFVLTSDIHNKQQAFRDLMKFTDAATADFVVMDGDLANGLSYVSSDIFTPYMQPATEMFNGGMPMVMARGNHELRGAKSNEWVNYLGTPERTTYQAFAHGNAFYIVLDGCEDKMDRSKGANYTFFNVTEPYFQEQKEWLEKVVKSDAFRKAEFRIVITHIATHGQPDAYTQKRMREYFKDILNGNTPETRVHLMLSGHEHRYLRIDAGSEKSKVFKMDKMVLGKEFNYTVVSNDGPGWGGVEYSAMSIEVGNGKIEATTYDEKGNVFDKFSIAPDGKVTDLMEVKAL